MINTRTLINQINPSTLSPYPPHIHTSTSTHHSSVRTVCLFVPHLPSSSSSLSPPSLPLPVYSVININIINDIINGNYDDELRRNISTINQKTRTKNYLCLLPLICLFILPPKQTNEQIKFKQINFAKPLRFLTQCTVYSTVGSTPPYSSPLFPPSLFCFLFPLFSPRLRV